MCVHVCVYIQGFPNIGHGGGGGEFCWGGIFVLGEVNLRRADFDDLNLFRS